MARLSTVPPLMHQDILDLTATGLSVEKIAEKLNQKYNAKVSDDAVYKVQKRLLKERQAIAQNVLTKDIERTAGRDIRLQNEIIDELRTLTLKAKAANDMDKYLKLMAEFRQWHTKSIALTGMNKEQNNTEIDNSEIIEGILAKFNN